MTHTWDLYLHYHLCPKCSFILESRQDYLPAKEKRLKNLSCPRCGHSWEEEKAKKNSFAPLLGKPSPPSFNWD